MFLTCPLPWRRVPGSGFMTVEGRCGEPERVVVVADPVGGAQPAVLDQIVLLDEVIDQPERGHQRECRKTVVLLACEPGDRTVASQQLAGDERHVFVGRPRG